MTKEAEERRRLHEEIVAALHGRMDEAAVKASCLPPLPTSSAAYHPFSPPPLHRPLATSSAAYHPFPPPPLPTVPLPPPPAARRLPPSSPVRLLPSAALSSAAYLPHLLARPGGRARGAEGRHLRGAYPDRAAGGGGRCGEARRRRGAPANPTRPPSCVLATAGPRAPLPSRLSSLRVIDLDRSPA